MRRSKIDISYFVRGKDDSYLWRFGRIWNVPACPPLMNRFSLMCTLHFRIPSSPSTSRHNVGLLSLKSAWKNFFSKLLLECVFQLSPETNTISLACCSWLVFQTLPQVISSTAALRLQHTPQPRPRLPRIPLCNDQEYSKLPQNQRGGH